MYGVARISSDDPLERKFHGTCAFVRLHLMRVAEGDEESGFAAARGRGMIDAGDERFIRESLAFDDALVRGIRLQTPVDEARIERLQTCVAKLNMGDSA